MVYKFHLLKSGRNKIVVCFVAWAFGFVSCQKKTKIGDEAKGAKGQPNADAPANNEISKDKVWSYFKVQRTGLYDILELDGKLESVERIELRADKRMRISPAKFKVGSPVKRGDVLFAVDTKDFEQKKIESEERVAQLNVDIKSSKAQFEFASKQLERKTALTNKGIVAQKDLEEAQKAFVAAESDLKTKELELRKAERELAAARETVASANVVSPIDGIIASIVPGGDDANQGQALAVVTNPTQLGVGAAVNEAVITKLKVGQKVEVLIDAEGEGKIEGTVKSLDTSSQQKGSGVNQYKIFVVVAPELVASLKLRDGYSARIRAVFGGKEMAIVIPKAGIKRNGKDTYALVADANGGALAAKAIKVGMQTELEVEVLDGLKEGSYVAVSAEAEVKR